MAATHGAALQALAAEAGGAPLALLPVSAAEASPAALAEADCAWYSRDLLMRDKAAGSHAATRRLFALVDAAPRLQWLHVLSAGIDLPPYAPSIARGIRLSTSSGLAARPIAQTVLAAVMARARPLTRWLDAQRERRWAPLQGADSPPDLDGQTAVIVGLGPIGAEIARLLRAVGLHTIGVRRSAAPSNAVDRTLSYADIDQALPGCDWLILCCPLSDETRGLIDRRRLALLPPSAQVINVGRGPVLDEQALVEALQAGRLGGAYLDVFEEEPLPADSPLWGLPQAWLSPHNSAVSQGNGAREQALFFGNLRRYLRGEPLSNEVPAKKGGSHA